MGTFRQITYQIVFSTKHRLPSINPEFDHELYGYIGGVLKEKNCQPLCINGIPDHVHIMTDIHPSVCVADLVKDIKLSTSDMMKGNPKFPAFEFWQGGYGAFTYSYNARKDLYNYISNQKKHHEKESFYTEYINLLIQNGIEFDEKYLL